MNDEEMTIKEIRGEMERLLLLLSRKLQKETGRPVAATVRTKWHVRCDFGTPVGMDDVTVTFELEEIRYE